MPKKNEIENEGAFKHSFNLSLLKRLTDEIAGVYPQFSKKMLLKIATELETLEMKDRVKLIRDELKRLLPEDYLTSLKIIRQILEQKKLSGFDLWPFAEFIQTFGLDHVAQSLQVLSELTPLFTAEWAVRPFIRLHEKQTMSFLLKCAKSPSADLRRWASEGSRPRLPWGERLRSFIADPRPTQPILDELKFDTELYVRKSVANHLNDIAKDHPDFVFRMLSDWKSSAQTESQKQKLDWITRHSLRSLIKAGNSSALQLVGISSKPKLQVGELELVGAKSISIGRPISFQIEMKSTANESQKIVVDYIIHHLKANGQNAPKVFKWKTFHLPAKGKMKLLKNHSFKVVTTRKYYPGLHHVEVQVNGKKMGTLSFQVKK